MKKPGPSKRGKAARWLADHPNLDHGSAEAMLEDALNEHANELAEEIRESAREAYSRTIAVKGVDLAGAWVLGHDRAAALIDPEVPDGTPDAG